MTIEELQTAIKLTIEMHNNVPAGVPLKIELANYAAKLLTIQFTVAVKSFGIKTQ